MRFLPRAEALTLPGGWGEDKVDAFTNAIEQVAIENLILLCNSHAMCSPISRDNLPVPIANIQ